MKRFLLLLIFVIPLTCSADFWENHTEGWHWYQVIENQQEEVPPSEIDEQAGLANLSATARIEALQMKVKDQLNEAMISPTSENIYRYLTLQRQVVNMASEFSKVWQRVVWQNPELDRSIQYPMSQSGKDVYHQIERDKRQHVMKNGQHHYGLLFYFSSSCPYCHRMAPTVKSFSEYYDFDIIAISLDGKSLPEFPNPRTDNGSVQSLQINTVPALYLVDISTENITPVGFGMMDFEEIEMRIVVLMEQLNGDRHA